MNSTRPLIAVTIGDPGGIGPEVTAKALNNPEVQAKCRAIIIGHLGSIATAAQSTQQFVSVSSVAAELPAGAIRVLTPVSPPEHFEMGKVAAPNGRAAHQYIVTAAKMAIAREVDAICTAPISKEAMFAAGFDFPGHTELLARLCGDLPVRMMLSGGGLRAVLQTIHVALATVPSLLTRNAIEESLKIMNDWGAVHLGTRPRIAVCGLNPHAGEGGHFGNEEIETIAPAVAAAKAGGINATGPYPADTVFHRVLAGEFDLVLAMYHDQALIPVKTLDFHHGVNITLGLPIIRTSPDHGTAFDLVGKGVANPSSMVSALLAAADLARARAKA